MKSKFSLLVMMALCAELICSVAIADKPTLVNGAAPLAKGRRALSFDLGFDVPEPYFYGLRADWGLSQRYQLGAEATTVGVATSVGLNNTFNLWKSSNEAHYLSFLFSPFLSFWNHARAFVLMPAVGYEARVGREKNTGLFVNAGTIDAWTWSKSGGAQLYNNSLDANDGNTKGWHHFFKFTGGVQHQFHRNLALTFQLSWYSKTDFHFSNSYPLGKIGFTWKF